MHTYRAAGATIFNYNSDYSGNVLVRDQFGVEVAVPMQDILEFVAEYARMKAVTRLEVMTTEEIIRRLTK